MFVRGVPSKDRFNACRLVLPKRVLLSENSFDTIANETHAVNRLKERGHELPLRVFFRPNHSMIGFGEGNHYTGFSLTREQLASDQHRPDIKSLFQLDGLSVALEARVGVVDVKLRKDWRDFVACTFWAATGNFESRCEQISRCFPSRKQKLFAAMLAGKESLSQMASYKSKLDCGSNLTMQPYSDSEELTVMYSMRTWRDEQGRQPTFNLLHEAMLSIDGEAPAELMVSGLASNYDVAYKRTSALGNDWTINVTSGYADGFNPLTDGAIGNIYPLLWWQAEETDDPREGIALNLCKGESGGTLELCGFCERAEIQSLLRRIREGSSDLRGAEIQEWREDPSTRWT